MAKLPRSIEKAINEFSKLPGIGAKSASRLAFYLLKRPDMENELFADAIQKLKTEVVFCSTCHNMAETDPCNICSDPNRDHSIICVVEEPMDALALDATGAYKGLFHILGGVLNPLEGIGPEKLNMDTLIQRLERDTVKEVIIATNPSLEGETTSMHLQKILDGKDIKVTRLARGLPIGGDLEYADEITITRALQGRS